MSKQPLIVERVYNAPVARVWQAITDITQMRQWYFNMSDFRPEVGFEFQFEGCSESETYVHHCKVLAVIPHQKLVYSWTYVGHEGYSEVSWELYPEGDNTRLILTHSGLESFPDKPDFAVSSFTQGWTEILGKQLKEFVEEANVVS